MHGERLRAVMGDMTCMRDAFTHDDHFIINLMGDIWAIIMGDDHDHHRGPTYKEHKWSRSQQSSMPKQQSGELSTENPLKSKTTVGLTSAGPVIVKSEGEVVTAVM